MSQNRPIGITGLSYFFFMGACISCISAFSLLFPGSFLEMIWGINPKAHDEFISIGMSSIILLFLVCVACTLSSIGLWYGFCFGHRLALVVFFINLMGDAANVLFRHDFRSIIGVPIVLFCMVYLLTKRVQKYFSGLDQK